GRVQGAGVGGVQGRSSLYRNGQAAEAGTGGRGPDARRGRLGAGWCRVSSGDRERVDLDEVSGLGESGYSHDGVGGFVLAEQGLPGLLDDRKEFGLVAAHVDGDLGYLVRTGPGGG